MSLLAVFDTRWFALPARIATHYERIRAEVEGLRADEFADWPERAAYSNGWKVFTLRMDVRPAGFAEDLDHNRRRCPELAALLADPRIPCAGISRLLPGCHVFPHSDRPDPGVMRFHMGIRCRGRAGLRIGVDEREQVDGQSYVFDHAVVHEAANLGTEPRDVLLVDFVLSAEERAVVARLRGGERAAQTA